MVNGDEHQSPKAERRFLDWFKKEKKEPEPPQGAYGAGFGMYPLWKFHKFDGFSLKPVPMNLELGYGIPPPPPTMTPLYPPQQGPSYGDQPYGQIQLGGYGQGSSPSNYGPSGSSAYGGQSGGYGQSSPASGYGQSAPPVTYGQGYDPTPIQIAYQPVPQNNYPQMNYGQQQVQSYPAPGISFSEYNPEDATSISGV